MSSQRFPPNSIAVSLFTNRETAMLSNFHTTQHVIPFKACQKIVCIIIIHCADSQVSFDKLISSRKKNYLRKEKKMEKLVIRLVCWGKRCQQVSCPREKQLNSHFLSNHAGDRKIKVDFKIKGNIFSFLFRFIYQNNYFFYHCFQYPEGLPPP